MILMKTMERANEMDKMKVIKHEDLKVGDEVGIAIPAYIILNNKFSKIYIQYHKGSN